MQLSTWWITTSFRSGPKSSLAGEKITLSSECCTINPPSGCKPSARIQTETESRKVTIKPIKSIYQTTNDLKIKVSAQQVCWTH